ncbi:hypothetical protein GLYMA_14G038550v4 [Glycine max]|nr:hypothetical protein GLYMA_14G038550v4 [Glycine max]KAH1092985.1 hypothetical protein GYH30_038960 [Glycine max]
MGGGAWWCPAAVVTICGCRKLLSVCGCCRRKQEKWKKQGEKK